MDDFLHKNYFELFGLRPQFAIDLMALRESYRGLQKAVHPDKFAADTSQAQRLALQYTAYANQAFQALTDPIARGFYLLDLMGHSCQPESATIQDGMFLMRQMELRERMEVADEDELEVMLEEVESEAAALEKSVAVFFQQMTEANDFEHAEALLKKM